MGVRDLVPPILLRALKKTSGGFPVVYPTYEEAAAACASAGYEDERLVAVIREKTRRLRDALRAPGPLKVDLTNFRTPLGIALASRGSEMRVIDYGGACGAHYFTARKLLDAEVKLIWNVVETPAMAAGAKDLENDELRFFSDVDEAWRHAGTVDLLFSSGTLQYVPDAYGTVTALLGRRAERVFLTRLGLSLGPREIVCVQRSRLSTNGPGPLPAGFTDREVRYPMTAMAKESVERIIGKDYEIRIAFEEDKGAYWPGGRPIDLYGYFAVRRRA